MATAETAEMMRMKETGIFLRSGHRTNPLLTMKVGLVLQIATYALFATGVSAAPALCALSLALGVSKAFFTPAAKAALVALTPGDSHYLLFSFRSTVNNLGVAVAALGVLLAVRAPSAPSR
ncbi:hypothetical protein [Pseudomonas sp. UBA4617]|uniref:hypothetical protein n=1 Tax=Pseudomonas sp. UBA4617 TaxID=1947318 RepID=UPI0025E99FCA|nr:hypothetical protein [Pseudomonas sp. UBA4617]